MVRTMNAGGKEEEVPAEAVVTSAEKGEKKKAKKRPGESEQTAEGVDKPSKKLKKPEMEENDDVEEHPKKSKNRGRPKKPSAGADFKKPRSVIKDERGKGKKPTRDAMTGKEAERVPGIAVKDDDIILSEDEESVESSSGDDLTPTIGALASHLKEYMPPQIHKAYTDDFLVATAECLLSVEESIQWKRVACAQPDDESIMSTNSKGKVSFYSIGSRFIKNLQERYTVNLPAPFPKIDGFRNDTKGTIRKYFQNQSGPAQSRTKMEKFASIYCGFIVKLYFSKFGYNIDFKLVRRDVGDFIADNALKSGDFCSLLNFRLVLPMAMISRFKLEIGNVIPDTAPKQQQMISNVFSISHTDFEEPAHLEFGDDLHLYAIEDDDEAHLTYEERIVNKKRLIKQFEREVDEHMELVQNKKDRIKQLKDQIESLKRLIEEKRTAESLVSGMRKALQNDEETFKEMTALLIELAPDLAEFQSQMGTETLKTQIKKAISEFNSDKPTEHSSKSSASLKSSTETNNAATTNSTPPRTSATPPLSVGALKKRSTTDVKEGGKGLTTKKGKSHYSSDNSSKNSIDDDEEDGHGNDVDESGAGIPVIILTDDDGNSSRSQETKETSQVPLLNPLTLQFGTVKDLQKAKEALTNPNL